ncbi:MAG TPA: hypothetical protein VMV69_30560 [Pirellulales bacterium]|nr:hypothetical protein [Pirellulales bacterium]
MTATAQSRFFRVEARAEMYRGQTESEAGVVAESSRVVVCFDFRDLVIQGNGLFDSINSLDDDWRLLVLSKALDFDPSFEGRIKRLYRSWLVTSRRVLEIFAELEDDYLARGFDIDPVRNLRSACGEAGGLLTSDSEFFNHGLTDLRDEAIDSHERGETLEMVG